MISSQPDQINAVSVQPEKTKSAKYLTKQNWWQNLSLRTKTTVLAIALGTLPVLAVVTLDYFLSSKQLQKDALSQQQILAISFSDEIGRFMYERYGDIQVLSKLPMLNNSNVAAAMTLQQKQAVLDGFVKAYGVYDSIAVADLAGNTILQNAGEPVTGLGERDYFKEVIRTKQAVITPPRKSALTGEYSIFLAAPILEINTGKMTGMVRTRIPVKKLDAILTTETSRQTADIANLAKLEYHLVDSSGKFFAAKEKNQLGRDARANFAGFAQLQAAKKLASIITVDKVDGAEQVISYAPLQEFEGMPKLNWSVLIAEDTGDILAPQRQLLLTLILATGVSTLIIAAIGAYLARLATRPILAASEAVEKLGQGELDTRIEVEGQDELAKLGSNINNMAGQIQTLLKEQEESARQQMEVQAAAAQAQTKNAQEQRLAKENLQKRALELLIEVDPLTKGDLTIRANVTEDEIGTIADSYNATIGSLRKIVTQVQSAAQKMTTTTSTSEVSVQELSTEALRQTEEITAALDRIQEMSSSIRAVAQSAEQAEAAVKEATQTVQEGDAAMNRTVDGILAIKETVAETSKKVNQLGQASEKISKVVNLISTFAAQTNLLALKASIEAARAGEEGRGFAVLADEVRMLARQSAQATGEIESLVANIQTETKEVVAAMEAGTEQVVTGTKLVDETRQSLNKINAVSNKISALVESIASATVVQSQASQEVTQSMTDVAAIANKTSNEANQVSASFKELLAVASELQASASQFKVS